MLHSSQIRRNNQINYFFVTGNPFNFYFEPYLEGDTHQFTAAPLQNEAMAASIAGESIKSEAISSMNYPDHFKVLRPGNVLTLLELDLIFIH